MTIEALYRENYPVVYGYLLSLCGNSVLAEDLTSETFLRAMQKLHTFQGDCKPSTWLCAIGKNLYYNERKRLERYGKLKVGQIFVSGDSDLEAYLLDRELAEQILKVSGMLQESHRQVFYMRVSGMSFREIGDAMGKTENWARVTFFRVKNKIMEALEV